MKGVQGQTLSRCLLICLPVLPSDLRRSLDGSFLFSVDHCFPIRGQGTVLTGTVLRGSVALNQTVELPALKLQRKVKSLQMFHRPVAQAHQVGNPCRPPPSSIPELSTVGLPPVACRETGSASV